MKQLSEIKPNDAVCFNCKFGEWNKEAGQVVCHRFPPTAVLMNVPVQARVANPNGPTHALVSQALPAALAPDWWCGEFKIKAGILS